MGLKVAGANLLLKGGLFNRSTYVAARSSATAELTGSGYGRAEIASINADTPGWSQNGRLYKNAAAVDFPVPTETWLAISHWSLHDAEDGGSFLLSDVLQTPGAAANIGASVGFDAGKVGWFVIGRVTSGASTTLDGEATASDTTVTVDSATDISVNDYLLLGASEVVQVTGISARVLTVTRAQFGTTATSHADGEAVTEVDDSITQEGSLACLDEGLVSGTRYLTLHSAKPGDTGGNQVGDALQAAEEDWTLSTSGSNRRARNNSVLTYGASTTDLDAPTWVALRDGNATDANVLWRQLLSPAPANPKIGDSLSFATNALVIAFGIDT